MQEESVDVVEASPTAVLPVAVVRASVIGALFTVFTAVHLVVYWQLAERIVGVLEPVRYALVALVLPVTVVAVAAIAWTEYGGRRYEFGSEGVTVHRGVFRDREQTVPYEAIRDVRLTRTRVQRLFDVGTVRAEYRPATADPDDDAETLWFGYVEDPESVYERLKADTGMTAGGRATGDAVTVPRETIHADPRSAALTGLLKGLLVATFSVGLLGGFGLAIVLLTGGPVETVGLGVLGLFLAVVGWYGTRRYHRFDRHRYEIYDDHLERHTADGTTSVPYDDVTAVTVHHGLYDGVTLDGADDDVLVTLKFVSEPDRVADRIERVLGHSA
jgi:membrane protein YdbS with pleckstrin-like domain